MRDNILADIDSNDVVYGNQIVPVNHVILESERFVVDDLVDQVVQD